MTKTLETDNYQVLDYRILEMKKLEDLHIIIQTKNKTTRRKKKKTKNDKFQLSYNLKICFQNQKLFSPVSLTSHRLPVEFWFESFVWVDSQVQFNTC